MMPHKTARGAAALARLTVHDGMPHPYDRKKKMVIPDALKVLRLKAHRKYCVLGDLSEKFGWKSKDLLAKLEARRVEKAGSFFKRKVAAEKKVAGVRKGALAKLSGAEKDVANKVL